MPLVKNKIFRRPTVPSISKRRFVLSLLIGLGYAINFYCFIFLFREAFRMLAFCSMYYSWILDTNDIHFYNFFFAALALIIGQSVTLSLLLDRPKRMFANRNYWKITAINDLRNLNWVFLSWGSRLAFALGIVLMIGGPYVLNIYSEYFYLLILMIIVLFLHPWLSLRRLYRKEFKKWFLISFFGLTVLSFGLSKINPVDPQIVNKLVLSKDITHNYILDIPESDVFKVIRVEERSLYEEIHFVFPKEKAAHSNPIIIYKNEPISLNELILKLNRANEKRRRNSLLRVKYRLNIHKEIKMKFVANLYTELTRVRGNRVQLAVQPADGQLHPWFYRNHCIPTRIPGHLYWTPEGTEPLFEVGQPKENTISMVQLKSGNVIVSNTEIKPNDLSSFLRKTYAINPKAEIQFHVNKEADFASYIKIVSCHRKLLNEAYDNYTREHYHLPYESISYDIQKKIEVRKNAYLHFEEIMK